MHATPSATRSLVDIHNPLSGFSGDVTFKYKLRWTIVSPCDTTYDELYLIPFSHCGQLVDSRDGQIYQTISTGTQCWMKQNLNVGIMLPSSKFQSDNDTVEKHCYGHNLENCNTYGGLYKWSEAMDYTTDEGTQGICPDGWHFPADGEWDILVAYIGSSSTAGGKMKETGTSHWASPNTGATNESGFTGLPGGYLLATSNYLGYQAWFWASTMYNPVSARFRQLRYDESNINRLYWDMVAELSVRCLKNSDQ